MSRKRSLLTIGWTVGDGSCLKPMFWGKTIEDSECYIILFCHKRASPTIQAILSLDAPRSSVSSAVSTGVQILFAVPASTQQDRIRVDFWTRLARPLNPNRLRNLAEASIRSRYFLSIDCIRDQSDH